MINLPPKDSGEPGGESPKQLDEQSEEGIDDGLISRSQRKREAEEITSLGQLISELPDSDLKKIPLEERVATAVHELRKIRSFGAKKRQLHYLGKVLRQTDLAPIRNALKAIQLSAKAETQLLHTMEKWRDRLLTEGDSALTEFLQQYPSANRQQFRQLMRNHSKETEYKKTQNTDSQHSGQKKTATKSAREIFKLIRATLSVTAEE